MYKNRGGKSLHKTIRIDAGLGIDKLHANSRIPKKTRKKHKLSKGEKGVNKLLARKRVVIEHVNAKIKTFKSWHIPTGIIVKDTC
ncbi:hypothetical protein Holit_03288 [Hollandina sp. SP2]